MSAGKLSRLAGSVFVLAAVLGGISAANVGAGHGTGGTVDNNTGTVSSAKAPTSQSGLASEIVWG